MDFAKSAEEMRVSILCPSKARPENLEKMVTTAMSTAADPTRLDFVFCVHADDTATLAKRDEWIAANRKAEMQFLVLPAGGVDMAWAYTNMSEYAAGDVFMYAADDLEFQTPGWDATIRKFFWDSGDRVWLAWCHDPAREEPFPDHGFISRWGRNTLRYFFPTFPAIPGVEGSAGIGFTDIWLNTIYQIADRRKYMPDITIAHRHWRTEPTVELDDGYVASNILSGFRKSKDFILRSKEAPEHANNLKRFIGWCAKGGLDRLKMPHGPTPVSAEATAGEPATESNAA